MPRSVSPRGFINGCFLLLAWTVWVGQAFVASPKSSFCPKRQPLSLASVLSTSQSARRPTDKFPFGPELSKRQDEIRTNLDGTRLSSLGDNIDIVLNPDKDLLTTSYRRGRVLYWILAAVLFLIPDRTASTLLASKYGGAAGYAIAGGLCHILAGANEKDRLSSDTYTRLNVGLLGFSALGILFAPAEAGFFFTAPPAIILSLIMTLAQGYGILVSFLGWKRGVDPAGTVGLKQTPQNLVNELRDGTKTTLKGLRVENAKKALAYRNSLIVVAFGIVSCAMEGFFNWRYREALQRSWFEVSLQGSAVSRLFMISTILYSLKDAAERDRLTGTTFIQLNWMLALWSSLVGIGQAIYPMGFVLYRGIAMLSFSLLFVTKAVKSQVQKRQQAAADRKALSSGE